MNRIQTLQMRQAELQTEIADQLDADLETRSDDQLETLTDNLKRVQRDLAAALLIAPDETPVPTTATPEALEYADLIRRSAVTEYMSEALDGRAVTGASRELRDEVLGADAFGYVPIDVLLDADDLETRADAVTNVANAIQDNQETIMPRVFARSAANYLGVRMPSVGVGTVTYPRLDAGTAADVRSDGVEVDGTAATLAMVSVNPTRLTSSYTFGVETLSRVQGFEAALRRDLRSTMQDKIDKLVLNGQAAVANVSAKVDGVINSLTAPADPTQQSTWQDFLGAYDASVDGIFANGENEVRLLVNAATYQYANGVAVGTDAAGGLLRFQLPADRFRVSANMPATSSRVSTGIAYAAGAGGMVRGFYAPIWRGIQIINDPYTAAKKGQRLLTAIMMVSFAAVDTRAHKLVKFYA